MQSTDGAVAPDEVQLTVVERLSRIPCLLILPHWLQLMGTPNPWWFNQRNDGRLARYFTAIYCKRDGVLLMTPLPLPLSAPPLLTLSFPWSHVFHQQILSISFTLVHKQYGLYFLSLLTFPPRSPPRRLPQQRRISKTRGLRPGRSSTTTNMASFLHYPLKNMTREEKKKNLDSSCQCLRLCRCLSRASLPHRQTSEGQRKAG